jgi:EmrB/QacA subfamily drug resistance transporter
VASVSSLSRGTKVLALTSIGVFLVSLDVSVLNVAFGDMLTDFGTDRRRALTWVFSGYNIAYAAGLLTAGRLADVFGRKRAFLWGLGIFAIGSFLCGVAPNVEFVIAARVVQAVGGAMLTPASLALVLPEFPIERRSAAIGIWGAIGGIAAASGPTVGGLLVESLGWRWIFFVNLPFSVLAIVIGVRTLSESRDTASFRRPDLIGALLAMGGVGLVTLVIVQSEEWGWATVRPLVVLVVGFLMILAFVARCRVVTDPILDLGLMKLRFVSAANVAALVFSAGFFGMFFVNVQWLQQVWGYSATGSGLAMTPGPLTAAIVAYPAGRVVHRLGHHRVIALGALLLAGGITVLNLAVDTDAQYWSLYFPLMVITGAGVGLALSSLSSAATAYLPPTRYAMGSALNTTFRQVGAALGLAIVASLLTAALSSSDPSRGFHHAWWFVSASVAAGGVVMMVLFRRPTNDELARAA